MKRILIVIISVVAFAGSVFGSEPEVKVIDSDNRSVLVEILNPPYASSETAGPLESGLIVGVPGYNLERVDGRFILPSRSFLFSLNSSSDVRVDLIEADTEIIGKRAPAVFRPGPELSPDLWEGPGVLPGKDESFVFLRKKGVYRKKPLALVQVSPVIYNRENSELVYASRILFRISHQPSDRRPPGLVPGFIHGSESKSPGGLEAENTVRNEYGFARSSDWIRLEVTEPGIYRVGYEDLVNIGVNPSGIDPAGIRLFSGGYFANSTNLFQQPASIQDGGSFESGYGMNEHSIRLVGMGDGEFGPDDYILFYGVGAEGWTDYLLSEASSEQHYDHIYENSNIYWMSWGGSFQGASLRMAGEDVSPSGPMPGISLDRYTERFHFEQDREYFPLISEDRWVWDFMVSGGSTTKEKTFEVSDIASTACRVRTIGFGGADNAADLARCYLNGALAGELSWTGSDARFAPDTLDAVVSSLQEGRNSFQFQKNSSSMEMNIYWYQIFFERFLKPDPDSGDLDFFAPDTTGEARFTMTGFSGETYLFDVTDYYNPVFLSNAYSSNDSVIFDYNLGQLSNHFIAVSPSDISTPSISYEGGIVSLRDEQDPPSMVVIYHSNFEQAAAEFVAHRSSNNPPGTIKAVDIEDVYSNFSGGLKDPIAVRNYLKYLYDSYSSGGEPVIEYALLMGKGTFDPKDVKGAGKDFIPFYFRKVAGWKIFVEYDDYLVMLDDSEDIFVDIAIGRLPFQSVQNADTYIDKLRGYESSGNTGTWRNKLIFVADDEFQGEDDGQFLHMEQTERISSSAIERDHFDKTEIYLHEYPFDGSLKPKATAALVSEWTKGGLLVCYFGHGSPYQLADELVLKKSDVYSLNNGYRLPLFLALSCSVGDQENLYDTSLSTDLLMAEGRGSIASLAAVTITLPSWNENMCRLFLRNLFPSGRLEPERLGKALSYAKINSTTSYPYILSGDPSMYLAVPELDVRHAEAGIDTLMTGFKYAARGSVMVGGSLDTGFDGTAEVLVREAEKKFEVDYEDYNHEGSVMYRGTAEVAGGLFDFQFIVPLRCRVGDRARIRSYVHSGSTDGVGACDTLKVLQNPSTPENDGPPRVSMYFNNMATRVKKGSRLSVDIQDENGIAILGKDPQNSILLEFDDSGYPIQVTEYFQYDHNSFTSGGLEYTLNEDYEIGDHSVLLRVFDNLGEQSTDTLNFSIVEEGIHKISDSFNFPNPFSESTNFVFQLTSRADVELSVYNLSGKKIWQRKINGVEGYNSIYWDGTDYANNTVANGTYIYLIDARFPGALGRNEKVKGKVVVLK